MEDYEKDLNDLDPWKNFHREYSVKINGKKFKIKSYGFCVWNKVIFLWDDGKEFYRLSRNLKSPRDDKGISRREYSNNKLIRIYKGPQNCFIELIEFILKGGDLNTAKKLLKFCKKTFDNYLRLFKSAFESEI